MRRLVMPLLRTPPETSLVLGLYGEWGHGKSSALNLLERALEEIGEPGFHERTKLPHAQIVRFTPWLYGTDTLLRAFFETLAASIGGFEDRDPEKRQKLKAALTGLGEFVAPAVKFGALVLAGPAGGALAGAAGDLITGVTKATAEATADGEKAFHRLREEAAGVLRGLGTQPSPRRVVVLVDDLDRAAGVGEVLAMLKMVKLVADLPNVSYVLAMDRLACGHCSQTRCPPAMARTFSTRSFRSRSPFPRSDRRPCPGCL